MSKSTRPTAATVAMAAMATILAVAVPPAAATNNGVSEKRVRAIVKQEVKKIPRVRGPKGDTGPAGPPGVPGPQGATGPAGMPGAESGMLFAHVFSSGTVDPEQSSGIADENIVVTAVTDDGDFFMPQYCFRDLPPVRGGQVTVNPADQFIGPPAFLSVGNGSACVVVQHSIDAGQSSFYILLY